MATSQRRRIFVNANRISAVDADGVRLRSWDVDLHPFKPRDGGTLARDALYWHYPHFHPGGSTPHSAIRSPRARSVASPASPF